MYAWYQLLMCMRLCSTNMPWTHASNAFVRVLHTHTHTHIHTCIFPQACTTSPCIRANKCFSGQTNPTKNRAPITGTGVITLIVDNIAPVAYNPATGAVNAPSRIVVQFGTVFGVIRRVLYSEAARSAFEIGFPGALPSLGVTQCNVRVQQDAASIQVCAYVYMYVCVYFCMLENHTYMHPRRLHMYIYTYIYTHTHTHRFPRLFSTSTSTIRESHLNASLAAAKLLRRAACLLNSKSPILF
jgi:hypothetical protein